MSEEMEKLLSRPTLTVPDAGRVLGICRASAYDAVRRGEIESIVIGKRKLVPTAALRRKLGITPAGVAA